jgi:hypothetical protein
MPATQHTEHSDFQKPWAAFVVSVRGLLEPAAEDRTLDQYLNFRDQVIQIVQDEMFARELGARLQQLKSIPPALNVGDALYAAHIEELRAATRAADVLQSTTAAGSEERKKAVKAQLSKASVTLGSFKDVAGELPYLKAGIGLFKELVDFFK